MLVILNSLNAHNYPIFQRILMILVSKFIVHRALSDKSYLNFFKAENKIIAKKCYLNLFNLDTVKQVYWQGGKFQMKCLLMSLHCLLR